ncbi:MAG: S8 family serine peptidase [Gemmatimonadetes bacterium]|nr:S8 family serine peptidase [Gemmatimonadota bacterium]
MSLPARKPFRSAAAKWAALLFLLLTLPAQAQEAGARAAGRALPPDTPPPRIVWVFLRPGVAETSLPAGPPTNRGAAARAAKLPTRAAPVTPETLLRIRAAGARIRYASRWLGAVSAWADSATLERLRQLPEVQEIRPVRASLAEPLLAAAARGSLTSAAAVTAGTAHGPASPPTEAGNELTAATSPLEQLGVPGAHALGLTGNGIVIALLDTGFSREHEALDSARVKAAWDFLGGDSVVANQPGDHPDAELRGTWVWSLLGGNRPGRLVGPAPGATFVLAKVDDVAAFPRADEDRWVAGLEWAVDSMGARIVSSSLTYKAFDDGFRYGEADLNGDVSVASIAADEAARRGVLVVNAMGDAGPAPFSLFAPADADSIIAVGAVDSLGQAWRESSRGPTADGRIKPDLAARGVDVLAASARGRTSYDQVSGTSIATPLIAGAAALLLEAWPELGPMDVRRALSLSASRARAPDNAVGAGVPDVASAVVFPEGISSLRVLGIAGAGTLTSLSPEFQWAVPRVHPRAGPVRYRLEISSDSQFASILYRDSVVNAFSIRLRQALHPRDGLWWRIVAETGGGVRRIAAQQAPLTLPPWVRLKTLNSPSGTFTAAVRPRLVWSALTALPPVGPLTFDVQVVSAQTGEIVQLFPGLTDTTVTAEPLAYNHPYRWRVIARSPLGAADTVESVAPFVVTSTDQPPATLLYQNFPNPFPRPGRDTEITEIWFDLDRRTLVELAVYDLRGRLVRRLVPLAGCAAVELDPGLYGREGLGRPDPCVLTAWDGRDEEGRGVPSGVYLLRMRTSAGTQIRRMLFLPD